MNSLIKLNRFTTIKYFEDLLRTKKLVLINPTCWEDSNDKTTIELFRTVSKRKSIYALCLTHQNETIHHWNAFAHGNTGCCIEISPTRFFKNLSDVEGLLYKKVRYIKINDLSKSEIKNEDLPFVKREPYNNEQEFRVILTNDLPQKEIIEIDVDLSFIRKVTINNKVSVEEFESIKSRLQQIHPNIKVSPSTIYNNPKWINYFRKNFRTY